VEMRKSRAPNDPDGLMTFICGVDAAERLLGESDNALKDRLRTLVSSFGAVDFLAFSADKKSQFGQD
jgi:hypothetical protein